MGYLEDSFGMAIALRILLQYFQPGE
jgi:hypothetical protein